MTQTAPHCNDSQTITDVSAITAALASHEISLRPIEDADLPFLREVYGGTRAAELALTDWSDEQRAAFVTMQFEAQHRYYSENYTGAAFLVVLWRGVPVGRLYLVRWHDELRLIDIALLPQHRGRGIGSAVLAAVLTEGQRLNLPVRIHVEQFNPALRLYARLGFRQIADRGVYYLLEKTPDAE
jgi:ribosomal protein S18 acetylase RimI-like enzyme